MRAHLNVSGKSKYGEPRIIRVTGWEEREIDITKSVHLRPVSPFLKEYGSFNLFLDITIMVSKTLPVNNRKIVRISNQINRTESTNRPVLIIQPINIWKSTTTLQWV